MTNAALGVRESGLGARVAAVIFGALAVALAAQVSIPLPGTPVPMTLQPMAVLLVGGLLGARLGALSMILYLAMGASGLPVFTPSLVLPPGFARLIGPTGGYLLAYPMAAWMVGRFSDPARQRGDNQPGAARSFVNPGLAPGVREPWVRVGVAVLAGLLLIHLGGLAQLAILTGDVSRAAQFATFPFLVGDIVKLGILVPVLTRLTPTVRARL